MRLNKDIHRKIMFQILQDIFTSEIGKHLAFKGGTACYFLHNLDRFSTDLDFDLLTINYSIDEQLHNILSKYGSIKKGSRNTIVSYGEIDMHIKIDINRKIWDANTYEIVNFYGIDIKVQDKSTIFANKLVALTERNTNRDIYDVSFFLANNFDINLDIIQERTGGDIIKLYEKIIIKLEKLPKSYKILDGLGEVLSEKQKGFIKQNLISKLIQELKFRTDFNNK